MNKLLLWIVAACFFTACNNKKTTKEESRTDTTKTKTTSTTDNKPQTDNDKPPTDVTNNDASNISTESGWVESDKTRFMYECETTAKQRVGATRANEYCNCMLDKLQGRYKSYAEANRETSKSEEDMNNFVDECNGKK